MREALDFRDLLETGNGVWAVLAFWLSAFMVFHVLMVRAQRRIPWRKMLFNFHLPLSMQMALGVLAVAFSVFLTRVILWWVRYRHPGDLDLLTPESWMYSLGTVLGIVGFLCILRTVSQPTFGHWPWVGALLSTATYTCWWAIDKIS